MNIKTLINWKLFKVLLIAGLFGTLCIFPYVLSLQGDLLKELPFSLPVVLAISLGQTAVILTITIIAGLFLGKKTNLGAPLLEKWTNNIPIKSILKKIVPLSLKLGILAGLLIIGFDILFSLAHEPLPVTSAPIWQGLLASFYGGIVEEILLRLFFMTLLVWIFSKFLKQNIAIWTAIFLASLLFGLAHLPATQILVELTPLIIARAILLNGIGGIIFGWLYWKKGIESAMIAHFSTDIVLHVLLPLLLIII